MIDRLEVGQNIFELIEFSVKRTLPNGEVRNGLYGVNVAKVREVVRLPKINPLASRVPGIAGIFEIRGVPIPAVHLAVALGDENAKVQPDQQIIVTEFSRKRAGFIVNSTHRIRRVAWDKVLPPASDRKACISGMTLVEDNEFLFILDLERILFDIEQPFVESQGAGGNGGSVYGGASGAGGGGGYGAAPVSDVSQILQSRNAKPGAYRILLLDDSAVILKNVKIALEAVGYDVVAAADGMSGKMILEECIKDPVNNPKIDMVVTDVEMPRMDGMTLTKWVKEHPELMDTPVILHTSLSGQANQEAGFQIGANGYVVKNDIRRLIHFMREILGDSPNGLTLGA